MAKNGGENHGEPLVLKSNISHARRTRVALLVLFGVGWVIYMVCKGIHDAAQTIDHQFSSFIGNARSRRFEKKRASLAPHIHSFVPNELQAAERLIQTIQADFTKRQQDSVWTPERPRWDKIEFTYYKFANQGGPTQQLNIVDIHAILEPNNPSWQQKEQELLARPCSYPAALSKVKRRWLEEFPIPSLSIAPALFAVTPGKVTDKAAETYFSKERNAVATYSKKRDELFAEYNALVASIAAWNRDERSRWQQYKDECDALEQEELALFRRDSQKYETDCYQQRTEIVQTLDGFRAKRKALVLKRVDHILASLKLPLSLPRFWNLDYDETEQILIAEIALPDVVHHPPIKIVVQKTGKVVKPLNQTERKELVPKIHPAIMLRTAYEILRNDGFGTIKLLALNGWIDYIDPHTGRETRAYTASLVLTAEQIAALHLQRVDALAAFHALKGKSSGKLIEIIPIEPTLNLKKNDSRFVDAKAVLDTLAVTTNLAAMDWQDFEHLIRELFEKEFSERGAEVKITRASRDRGVDAIAFIPDPIHGGKYIIQAKRYTNTVDVSAVRDLCAVVHKEGASRGILVTTSTYGADAHEFANNEPVTLLNGSQLLGLLEKHGYKFRIDLAEARMMRKLDESIATQEERFTPEARYSETPRKPN